MTEYRYCAKGGERKPRDENYVCNDHAGTRGWYRFCAACGKRFYDDPQQATRDYVCYADLMSGVGAYTRVGGVDYHPPSVEDLRLQLIKMRDHSYELGRTDETVIFAHTIAVLADYVEVASVVNLT